MNDTIEGLREQLRICSAERDAAVQRIADALAIRLSPLCTAGCRMLSERKVVQISQADAENGYTLVALCDDGTMWHRSSLWDNSLWHQVDPIPLPTPTGGPQDAES